MSEQNGKDRLAGLDIPTHNAEVQEAWAAYQAGKPYRVPIILGTNTRYYMLQPDANPDGLDFERYSKDPDVMFDTQLRHQRWSRFNLLQDAELGLPAQWHIGVDFQNYYDAAWFGCPLEYRPGEVPDTRPVFSDCPERVMERGVPGAFSGVLLRALEYFEHFVERAKTETFLDRPVTAYAPGCGTGTDGPMTIACNLFGADRVCLMMAAESDRLHILLDFITESLIQKMKAWRIYAGVPVPQDNFWMADDSVALISTRMYREHILPYHRRFYTTFGTAVGRGIHLCGNATRHFPLLCEELGISAFDTGFPVDFGALRKDLGPDVRIQGGPHVELLRSGTPEEVREDTRGILQSGILEGGMFVLREGNNLAPRTPLENTEAMYHAGREFGKLA